MKIYIAGPMTGYENFNRQAFHDAEKIINDMSSDTVVLNPAKLPNGLEQHEYMDICCAMIRACDTIYLLEGWSESKGATTEFHLADKLDKNVIHQGELDLYL